MKTVLDIFLEGAGAMRWDPTALDFVTTTIRAAVAEEREACARVAQEAQRFHDERCPGPRECRCADGHHVAMAIRARGREGAR